MNGTRCLPVSDYPSGSSPQSLLHRLLALPSHLFKSPFKTRFYTSSQRSELELRKSSATIDLCFSLSLHDVMNKSEQIEDPRPCLLRKPVTGNENNYETSRLMHRLQLRANVSSTHVNGFRPSVNIY